MAEYSEGEEAEFGWYERLRYSLAMLQQEFEQIANTGCNLNHARFEVDEEVSDASWEAFADAHQGALSNSGWEHWEIFHDEGRCGCFFGDGRWLPRFQKLAASGWLILVELASGTERPVPCEYRLRLPSSTGHLAWLHLIYDTALLNTPFLRTEVTYWKLDKGLCWDDLSDDEMWSLAEDGTKFPAHPLLSRLHLDVFSSSASAIRYWLDFDEIVTVGGVLDDRSPIVLPATITAEEDDPVDDSQQTVRDLPTTELSGPSDDAGEVPVEAASSEEPDTKWEKVHKSIRQGVKPDWDGSCIWIGEEIVKEYKYDAPTQRPLLDAFQKASWPEELDDPFRIQAEMAVEKAKGKNPKFVKELYMAKRRDAVKALNRDQQYIRFLSTKAGYGVRWEWKQMPDVPSSSVADEEID